MKSSIAKTALQVFPALIAVMFLVRTSTATTAIMLTDEQLITSSRVILLGKVRSIKTGWDLGHERIYTYVKIKVSEVLKGQLANEHIVFKQLGGTVGDTSTVIFGVPEYEVGERVLLFLDTAADGTLRIAHLFQGKYAIVKEEDSEMDLVERHIDRGSINLQGLMESPDITNRATLKKFNKKIRKLLETKAVEVAAYDERYAQVPIVEIPAEYVDDGENDSQTVTPQYTFLGSGFRWTQPDTNQPVGYRINPAGAPVAGGGIAEINLALAAWTNVQTTALVLQNAGSTTTGGFRADGVSSIAFNDPLNEITDPVGCAGTLAIGGVTQGGNPTTTIGGLVFRRIYEGDVVFNNNFQCFLGNSTNLAEVAAHEIGHSLGFGHSADGSALMYATAHGNGWGARLGADDIAAVSFLYPGSHSGGTAPAAPTSLSAAATSSSSIQLSWADNSNNENGFRLERKTGAGGTYTQIADLAAGTTSYSNTGLQPSTTYFYRVMAYNTVGNSAYSAEASATTSGTTPPPSSIAHTIGIYRPGSATFALRDSNSAGSANLSFAFEAAGSLPIAGDWNGDGIDTIGVFRNGTFYLRNSNSSGAANIVFSFGAAGDLPIVGDWNGDGIDTIGVFRNGTFFLRNSNSSGNAEIVFGLGIAGDVPLAGDWNGDGVDTTGVFRPSNGALYLKNANTTGFADVVLTYGIPGDKPVTGDWDGNGTDTIGVFRNGTFFLRNSNTNGFANIVFAFGATGDTPLAGEWNGLP